MHDAEKVVTLICVSFAVVALVVGYLVAVLVAQQYALLITLGLFLLIAFVVISLTVSHLRKATTERTLRQKRVLYREELPLNAQGTPYYLLAEMEVYPQGYSQHPKQEQGGSYEGY
ncbi:MAG TPA: hypothetical protein VFU49_05385 [Ktedonobacteraceae bacterium]|nr:hypothetical protein [Ktedonobacteraceae bacterium]